MHDYYLRSNDNHQMNQIPQGNNSTQDPILGSRNATHGPLLAPLRPEPNPIPVTIPVGGTNPRGQNGYLPQTQIQTTNQLMQFNTPKEQAKESIQPSTARTSAQDYSKQQEVPKAQHVPPAQPQFQPKTQVPNQNQRPLIDFNVDELEIFLKSGNQTKQSNPVQSELKNPQDVQKNIQSDPNTIPKTTNDPQSQQVLQQNQPKEIQNKESGSQNIQSVSKDNRQKQSVPLNEYQNIPYGQQLPYGHQNQRINTPQCIPQAGSIPLGNDYQFQDDYLQDDYEEDFDQYPPFNSQNDQYNQQGFQGQNMDQNQYQQQAPNQFCGQQFQQNFQHQNFHPQQQYSHQSTQFNQVNPYQQQNAYQQQSSYQQYPQQYQQQYPSNQFGYQQGYQQLNQMQNPQYSNQGLYSQNPQSQGFAPQYQQSFQNPGQPFYQPPVQQFQQIPVQQYGQIPAQQYGQSQTVQNMGLPGVVYDKLGNHQYYTVQTKGRIPPMIMFSGEMSEFSSWWVQFNGEVNEDYTLTTTQKYFYLQKAISKVKELSQFKDMNASSQAYIQCLNKLHQRFRKMYSDPEKIIQRIKSYRQMGLHPEYQTLLNLQQELNTMETYFLLGEMEPFFVHRILEAISLKLPDQIRGSLTRTKIDLETIRNIIEDLINIQDTKETPAHIHKESHLKNQHSNHQHGDKSQANKKTHHTLVTTEEEKITEEKKGDKSWINGSCIFCGSSDHRFFRCTKQSAERQLEASKQDRCLLCLFPRHDGECRGKGFKCKNCKSTNHFALCPCRDKKPENESALIAKDNRVCYPTFVFNHTMVPKFSKDTKVRALFDSGSGPNLITEKCATRLGLIPTAGLEFLLAGVTNHKVAINRFVKLEIRNVKGEPFVLHMGIIPGEGWGKLKGLPVHILKYMQNNGLPYNDDPSMIVEILIGNTDTKNNLLHVSSLPDGYFCETTKFGYVYSGGISQCNSAQQKSQYHNYSSSYLSTIEEIIDYHKAETAQEIQEKFLSEFLEKSVTDNGTRWEVRLPIIDTSKLQTNKGKCEAQLRRNVRSYHKSKVYEKVQKVLDEWKSLGVIQMVPIEEVINPLYQVHYLAHHAVHQVASETTKLRVVINGSLVGSNDVSLNDTVTKGFSRWCLIASIQNIRKFEFWLVGDITKAFLMVSVVKEHRDLLRILWLNENNVLEEYRFERVPFGTSASPFLLFAALEKTFIKDVQDQKIRKVLQHSFYVDDCVNSFIDSKERDMVRQVCEEALRKRGMTINWKVKEHFSVLGHPFDTVKDVIGVKFPEIDTKPKFIKDLLSIIAKIYDPCGYIGPYTAALRRILSTAYISTKSYESELSPEQICEISVILEEAKEATEFQLPRWVGHKGKDFQFHICTDANIDTIGLAIYGGVQEPFDLLYSKSKIHHRLTIPDAELDAIMLTVPILPQFIECYNPTSMFLRTDSLINVARLATAQINKLSFHQGLKVIKFKESFPNMKVIHVKTDENPADWLTKLPKKMDLQKWFKFVPPKEPEELAAVSLSVTVQSFEVNEKILEDIESSTTVSGLLEKYPIEEIVKTIQIKELPVEHKALSKEKPVPEKSVLKSVACSFINGVIYIHLRHDFESPKMYLPDDHKFTTLMIEHLHQTTHGGVDTVRAAFCQLYYSKNLRRHIQMIINRCTFCAENFRQKLKFPSGVIPSFRSSPPERAFAVLSADFAKITVGRKKQDLLLITCVHSRAIFLQALEDQTSLSILIAFTELFSVYGIPEVIYTDNQRSFTRAGTVMNKLMEALKEASNEYPQIKWYFSVTYHPKSNGLTERLVAMTKKVLKGIGLSPKTSPQMVKYYIAEDNRLMNSRPLFEFNGQMYTPMDMIIGHTPTALPHPLPKKVSKEFNEIQVIHSLRKRLTGMWIKWKEGYFLSLKDVLAHSQKNTVKPGDKVLLQGIPNEPREKWRTGTVDKVYPGLDGTTRIADVKLDNTSEILTRRSVTKMVNLSEARPGSLSPIVTIE